MASAAAAAEKQQEDLAAATEGADSLPPNSSAEPAAKWPGWPGQNVFRMVVPLLKVGSIIGRKGEFVKKMCEESGARIRILDGPQGSSERIVLVAGKENPELEVSPAMDAVLRVFKRVNEISDADGDAASAAAVLPTCSVRLLVSSQQAVSLIGKAGVTIKSMQEESACTIRVLSVGEVASFITGDERLVDIVGDSSKVLKALELVLGHLRKFLVDHSVIPLFDKLHQADTGITAAQNLIGEMHKPSLTDLDVHSGLIADRALTLKSDYLLRDSKVEHSGVSLYGQDPAVSGLHSLGLARGAGAIITNMTQTMQIPLSFAEDIIGIGGANIAYIRRTSGAILSIQETPGVPDEVTVEIKGSSSQVQRAQQLIQDSMSGQREPVPREAEIREPAGRYADPDIGYRAPYSSQYGDRSYSSSAQLYERYGSYGGYGSYRY